jgi:hypothetical protein
MVCVKCSAAADLAEAAHTPEINPRGTIHGHTIGTIIGLAVGRLHSECRGGTWCGCQHRTQTFTRMCTCLDPELPHRPHLCDTVRDRMQRTVTPA